MTEREIIVDMIRMYKDLDFDEIPLRVKDLEALSLNDLKTQHAFLLDEYESEMDERLVIAGDEATAESLREDE